MPGIARFLDILTIQKHNQQEAHKGLVKSIDSSNSSNQRDLKFKHSLPRVPNAQPVEEDVTSKTKSQIETLGNEPSNLNGSSLS